MTMQSTTIPLRILGTGEYQPSKQVSSREFDERWAKSAGWTLRHTGVERRCYADAAETTSMMGAAAAERALAAAQITPESVDCVISACCAMEQAIPCSAVLIQRRLGLESSAVPAFDINATCLSFIVALDVAACAIAAGRYRTVLIVASEIASAGLDWDDPDTAPLFGDGAAAVVVSRARPEQGSELLGTCMQTFSEGAEFCQIRSFGTKLRPQGDMTAFLDGATFEMSGRSIYRLAARVFPGFLSQALAAAGIEAEGIDMWIPHQASAKALDHLTVALNLPPERLARTLTTRGNQIAASIPVALHHAITSQAVRRGDVLALVGTGAGLSIGSAILRY